MRIGLVAGPWLPVPPPGYGGTERVIDALATGFADAGNEVLLYTTGDSTCPVPRRWVREHAVPERMGESVLELHHLIYAYEAVQDCDIIHDHTVLGPAYSRDRVDVPVVTTNHGPFTVEMNAIYQRVTPRTALVAISHDQASRSAAPVSAVIHHGLRLTDFPVGDGDGDYFLFLGRFHPDKGGREAVLAAREAGVALVLAAKMREPAEIEYFRQEVEPLLDSHIRYVGEVGMVEKLELLRGARGLVNPIQWPEPFGLVMIEALACGTPVFAYESGSAPEIVEHGRTGFICHDVAGLVAAIGKADAIDRSACRASVAQHFSAERMVSDHLALYDRLLHA